MIFVSFVIVVPLPSARLSRIVYDTKKAGLLAKSGLPLLPNESGSCYQFTRTPKRMTRGATMAWIWLAFAAF